MIWKQYLIEIDEDEKLFIKESKNQKQRHIEFNTINNVSENKKSSNQTRIIQKELINFRNGNWNWINKILLGRKLNQAKKKKTYFFEN